MRTLGDRILRIRASELHRAGPVELRLTAMEAVETHLLLEALERVDSEFATPRVRRVREVIETALHRKGCRWDAENGEWRY